MDKGTIKTIIVTVIIIAIFVGFCIWVTGCNSWQREMKSLKSDFGNGLDRTVTVYDYNGQKIDSWSGKFDVSASENEVYFDDANGKRVIIHGGIVINEEN